MSTQQLPAEISEMRSMGFTDDAMSTRALDRAGWDVESAVELLFQGAISDSDDMDTDGGDEPAASSTNTTPPGREVRARPSRVVGAHGGWARFLSPVSGLPA